MFDLYFIVGAIVGALLGFTPQFDDLNVEHRLSKIRLLLGTEDNEFRVLVLYLLLSWAHIAILVLLWPLAIIYHLLLHKVNTKRR